MSFVEDSDEDSESEKDFSGKEGIVFLVDATEPMFDCQQFSLAIQCVENMFKNKAISRPSDELAVILFGTDRTSEIKDLLPFDHIFVIQNLQKPSVKSILRLKDLNGPDFASNYGHNNRFSLAEAFSLAINEFTSRKNAFESKRVILFTNTSDPYSSDSDDDKNLRQLSAIRAANFHNYNIEFDLIPLPSKDNKPFDVQLFYGDIFPHLKEDNCDTTDKLEQLLRRIHSPFHKSRAVASIPFILGPNPQLIDECPEVKISVNVFNLYIKAKKPNTVRITAKDGNKVKTSTQLLTQDTKELVSKEEVSKTFEFGKQTIALKTEEIKAIDRLEEPSLILLGFKPRTALLSHLHIKPGHFIFPNESTITGSTTLFCALLKRCVVRDKIPICRFTLRKGMSPRLVALNPQLECKPLGKSGGFHVVYLPFKEDIRELDIKGIEQMPVPQEGLNLAKNIINKLTFDYDPKNFPNPVLQTHWRVIEGLALNQTIEPFEETQTLPNYEDIESKVGYDLYQINQLLGGYAVQPIATKKVKTYDDLSDMARNNQLGTLTVAELRGFCKQKKIDSNNLKKAELIAAIRGFYGSQK